MSNHLQNFLATTAEKTAKDLITALLRVPADKRDWSPQGDARTAHDLVAECAILNGSTADMIKTKQFGVNFNVEDYMREKAALCKDFEAMQALLEKNTALVAETIRAVPNEDLILEVQMPWGPMALDQICAYPYWNMSYHEGQINYIASMLGCLK